MAAYMVSSPIPVRLARRLEIGSITNEDLYELSQHISFERKTDSKTYNSDISHLLLHLSNLIKDLNHRNRWRKRLRLIKRVFNQISVQDPESFPFPACKDNDFCISIPLKFSHCERAREEFFKYISLNNNIGDFISYFSHLISKLSEPNVDKAVNILVKSIRRSYKNSLWNLYYFMTKTTQDLSKHFNELLFLLRDILIQDINFSWEESKSFPNIKGKNGLLSLTCIQKLISIVTNESELFKIATDLLSKLSGSLWNKSADLMIINLISRRLDKYNQAEICNFHNKIHSMLSSSLSTHSIDLIGYVINSCINTNRDCSGCNQLLDLLLNHMFKEDTKNNKNIKVSNTERYGNINISSLFAISNIPNKYIKNNIYDKIESYIQHISSKPALYSHEILLLGNNKIIKQGFLNDVKILQKYNPIKLICSSISEYPFPRNLTDRILEIRLAMNILMTVKPESLPYYKKWQNSYTPLQIFSIIEGIINGNKDEASINIFIPNESKSDINFYETFLFNGELTSKGQRELFESEIMSFIHSIRYLLPQTARSLALELLWEKGKYLNSYTGKRSPAIKFINDIINKVISLFPDPKFNNLCNILLLFNCPLVSNDKDVLYKIYLTTPPIMLDINESSELVNRYCESDHKMDIYLRFILLVIPMVHGNDILSSIIGHCFEIISRLSSLVDDDVALFLSNPNDLFIPTGMYLDKSIITGEKGRIMMREQKKTREFIGSLLLKAEKYFYVLENSISSDITGDTVDLLLTLIKESLVLVLTRKYSTLLLTKLTKTVISIEDKSINIPITSWSCIVDAYLAIHSISESGSIPMGVDKLLVSISNKRISRPLASLLLPIPLERLKLVKSNSNLDTSTEISSALSVLSSQLKQRLDLPVAMILRTLCQILSEMGENYISKMIDCIIELAFYPMDQECIEILSDYILSPSSHLRYAISQMISKRRDFIPQLYKYLKILVHDTGAASTPSRNVTIFYRQSKKLSIDPSEILDIKYDSSLEEVMPLMIGKTLSTTYFEGDSTFSELILIVTARYISSNPPTRIAILHCINNLLKNVKHGSKNEKYNPLDVEIILKFIVTVVLQNSKNIALDELQLTSNSNTCITRNALSALESLVMSEKIEIDSLNDMIEKLSNIANESSGSAPMIITRSCNLLKAMTLVRSKSTIKRGSLLIQVVNAVLDERYEMEEVWALFYSKTFASISKFEDKNELINLFDLCFNRMNKLNRGDKLEVVIHKSTLMSASFIISLDPKNIPLNKIIDYIYNGNRDEKLRSLLFIINLNSVGDLLKFFDSEMRNRIVAGLFPLLTDSYILIKNHAFELCELMARYESNFEMISSIVLNPDTIKKVSLGAIKYANVLIDSIEDLTKLTFSIEFLVEACLDSNAQVRSASVTCLKTIIDKLNLHSFPMAEYKEALISPMDGNIQIFLEKIQSIHSVQFSLIEPIIKRSIRSRNRKIRLLTLNYLMSYNLPVFNPQFFHPLLDFDEEEVDLICEVMHRMREMIRTNSDAIALFKESSTAKCSPLERLCYAKILSNITEYNDIREWSYGILTTNSPYHKIHGILMLFTSLNSEVFTKELSSLLEILAKLFNHENDDVREGAFGLFDKLILAYPDRTRLFIGILSRIFDNLTSKTAPSRDLALMLIPSILRVDSNIRNLDYSEDRDLLYANAYLMKFDVSFTVVETAERIWRRITFNTKTVVRNVLPRLLNILSKLNPSDSVVSCIESIISLEGDISSIDNTLIGKMIDHLLENKYIYLLKIVISSSSKNLLQDRMDEICKVVKDSCATKDSAISIETLGLLSKWVKTVMDDSLIDLFESALQDSTSPSFKTLNNLSIEHTKLLEAWRLVKPTTRSDDFWIVADLVMSKCPQNLSELYNTFKEIISLYNNRISDLTHIPIAGLFWNFGIRGPEFIFGKRDELPDFVYKSTVKSIIETAPSKSLIIELAPMIISSITISESRIMRSLFDSTDLPQHQGILIILIAQFMAQDANSDYKLNETSQFLLPTITNYLTHLTASSPSALGLAFNTQVAYSISFIMKNLEYKFIQSSALRLCGLIIRASGDWSNLLYKASLLSGLYHLIKLIVNGPNASITLRPIIPQLLSLVIKSFGTSTFTEKPEMPFNPSYPTFTVSNDPCKTFPVPSLPRNFQQSTGILSPITCVRHTSLAIFQMIIPSHLERVDLAFNELLKVAGPGCPAHSYIGFEFLIKLKDSEEQVTKFKRLYEKAPEDRLSIFYNRVIAAHLKASNKLEFVDGLVKDVIANHQLESGMLFSQLDPSILVLYRDKISTIYKIYYQKENADCCKTIAINIFEQTIDPCLYDIAVNLLQFEVSYGPQTSNFLMAIERLIIDARNVVLKDEIALINLLKLLYNCIFGGMALKLQSEKILLSLVDSKPLTYYVKVNKSRQAGINEIITKLDEHISRTRQKDRLLNF